MFVWPNQYKPSKALTKFLRDRVKDQEAYIGRPERHSPLMMHISDSEVGLWFARGNVAEHTDYSRAEVKRTAGLVLINDRNHELFCGDYYSEIPVGSIFYIDASEPHGTCRPDNPTNANRPSFRKDDPHGLLVFVAIDVDMQSIPTPHDFLVECHTKLESFLDYEQEA